MSLLRADLAPPREAIDPIPHRLLLLGFTSARFLEERLGQTSKLQRHERDADDGGGGDNQTTDGRHGRDISKADGRERREAKIQSVEEVRNLCIGAGFRRVDEPRRLRVNYVSDIRRGS